MTIQITGTLTDPAGTGIANASIRFVSTSTTDSGAVKGTYSITDTDINGAYDIPTLLPGSYLVEVTHGGNKDKYITLGNCEVLATDTGSKTLQGLGIS